MAPLMEIDPTQLILTRLDALDKKLELDYVTRREHEAQNLPARVSMLESSLNQLRADLIQTKADLRELIVTTVNSAVKEVLQRELTQQADEKREAKDHFRWMSSQGLSILLPIIFFLLTVVVNILFITLTHH